MRLTVAAALLAAFTLVVGLTRAAGQGLRSEEIAFIGYTGVQYDLFMMDVNRNFVRQLLDTPDLHESSPVWSPDGTQLAFSALNDPNQDIYIINAAGVNLRRLTDDPAGDFNPQWSPDGRQIAFVSTRGSGDLNLFVMDVDGGSVRQLTEDWRVDRSPAWSPDGTQIAFYSNRDGGGVYLMDADGSNERPLVAGGDFPAWSPDGTQLAFISLNRNIYVLDMNSRRQRCLELEGSQEAVAWSADGRQLVFMSYRQGRNAIYAVNADGSDEQFVMNTDFVGSFPVWRPT